MARKQNDVSSEAFDAAGLALAQIDRALQGYRDLAVQISGFSVRGPRGPGDEVFLVIRGEDEEGAPVVSFHSAFTLTEAIRGLDARLSNGTLKWRADEFER